MLRTNKTLTVLDLGSNQIDNTGAHDLALALKENSTLVELYLNNNSIGEKGGEALYDVLSSSNTTLSVLDLGGNHISNALHERLDAIENLQKKRTGWAKQPRVAAPSITA